MPYYNKQFYINVVISTWIFLSPSTTHPIWREIKPTCICFIGFSWPTKDTHTHMHVFIYKRWSVNFLQKKHHTYCLQHIISTILFCDTISWYCSCSCRSWGWHSSLYTQRWRLNLKISTSSMSIDILLPHCSPIYYLHTWTWIVRQQDCCFKKRTNDCWCFNSQVNYRYKLYVNWMWTRLIDTVVSKI